MNQLRYQDMIVRHGTHGPYVEQVEQRALRKYWVSCPRFTIQVNTVNSRIVRAAPIVRKFIGQPLDNLIRWAGRSTQVTEL